MPVLSTRIVLDCFHLLIFYSEKFSTNVCRLPYVVNVNLNLSIVNILPASLPCPPGLIRDNLHYLLVRLLPHCSGAVCSCEVMSYKCP